MALIAESAELVEHFQWLSQSESANPGADKLDAIAEELADIQIYLVRIADKLDIDLLRAVDGKIVKNAQKYPAEKVRGQHRKYTEYD